MGAPHADGEGPSRRWCRRQLGTNCARWRARQRRRTAQRMPPKPVAPAGTGIDLSGPRGPPSRLSDCLASTPVARTTDRHPAKPGGTSPRQGCPHGEWSGLRVPSSHTRGACQPRSGWTVSDPHPTPAALVSPVARLSHAQAARRSPQAETHANPRSSAKGLQDVLTANACAEHRAVSHARTAPDKATHAWVAVVLASPNPGCRKASQRPGNGATDGWSDFPSDWCRHPTALTTPFSSLVPAGRMSRAPRRHLEKSPLRVRHRRNRLPAGARVPPSSSEARPAGTRYPEDGSNVRGGGKREARVPRQPTTTQPGSNRRCLSPLATTEPAPTRPRWH